MKVLPPLKALPKKWGLGGTGCMIAVALWLVLAYRATGEWQRSATLLAQRRAENAAASLVRALTQDMRGVQTSVLAAPWRTELISNPTSELQGITTAFARYPYPEVFFLATGNPTPDSVLFYSRSERTPHWLTNGERRELELVSVGPASTTAGRLLDRIAKDVARRQAFSAFDLEVDGVSYQVVNISFYSDGYRDQLQSIFGFMVNSRWAREHYFGTVVAEVARIENADHGLCFDIHAADGRSILDAACGESSTPVASRPFAVTFFDPLLVSVYRPADLLRETWTVRAIISDDPPLRTATTEARRTFAVASLAALVLAVGFVFAVRAARAEASLANMRSDFAAAVSHELKTPIATIQLVSERLASHRNMSATQSREYANLALLEAKRLRRLIDNLLTYTKLADVTDAYTFEPLEVRTLVEDSLKEFAFQLADNQFEVDVDIPADLPLVLADRMASRLMLSNVLDNAIRYSATTRVLRIDAQLSGRMLTINVTDRGVGMPEEDLALLLRRLLCGPRSDAGGTGLGLSIAHRIATDHGGSLAIRSSVGAGTTVGISLPIAENST